MSSVSSTESDRKRVLPALGTSGIIGVLVVGAFLLVAIFGEQLSPYDPNESVGPALEGPSMEHLLGTDELGRDQLSRVISAVRLAVVVAVVSVTLAMTVGTALGIMGGYLRGFFDWSIGRLMDILFAFPALILAMAIAAGLGPGVVNASIAIGIVYIPRFARVARASALSVRERPYIEAAMLCGKKTPAVLAKHVLPNIMTSILVLAALSMATAQLNYAALSFLGLGSSPPQADFGTMLSRARVLMTIDPWLAIVPAAALALLVVGFNLLGDAARDLADPKSSVKTAA